MRAFLEKNSKIVLLILIICQCLFAFYWGTKKANFYWDEYFTFQNAHYLTNYAGGGQYISESDVIKHNEWMDSRVVRDKFVVGDEESILNEGLAYTIKTFFSYKPYMILLNIWETAFFNGRVSKWSGISINIILLALNQIVLYSLTKKVSNSKAMAMFVVALYGFSGMCVSMTIFVRHYMWVTLMMTLATLLITEIFTSEGIVKNVLYELLLGVVSYLAYLNCPLVILYVGFMVLFVSLMCGFLHKWGKIIYFSLPILGGGLLYVLLFTNYFDYVINPTEHITTTSLSSLSGLLASAEGFGISVAFERIVKSIKVIGQMGFGSTKFLGIIVLVSIILLIKNRSYINWKSFCNPTFFIIVLSLIGFYVFSIVYYFWAEERYISYIVPEILMIIGIVFYVAMKTMGESAVRSMVAGCVLLTVIFTFVYKPITMLFPEDKEVIEYVSSPENNSVMIYTVENNPDTYIAPIMFAPENAEVMYWDWKEYDPTLFREHMLVWVPIQYGVMYGDFSGETDYVSALFDGLGYTVTDTMTTYNYVIYVVDKI